MLFIQYSILPGKTPQHIFRGNKEFISNWYLISMQLQLFKITLIHHYKIYQHETEIFFIKISWESECYSNPSPLIFKGISRSYSASNGNSLSFSIPLSEIIGCFLWCSFFSSFFFRIAEVTISKTNCGRYISRNVWRIGMVSAR